MIKTIRCVQKRLSLNNMKNIDDYTVLHSKFDIETHKCTFIDYLEVVITSDGVIHYAIPSHEQFCINLALEYKMFKSIDDIYNYLSSRNVI